MKTVFEYLMERDDLFNINIINDATKIVIDSIMDKFRKITEIAPIDTQDLIQNNYKMTDGSQLPSQGTLVWKSAYFINDGYVSIGRISEQFRSFNTKTSIFNVPVTLTIFTDESDSSMGKFGRKRGEFVDGYYGLELRLWDLNGDMQNELLKLDRFLLKNKLPKSQITIEIIQSLTNIEKILNSKFDVIFHEIVHLRDHLINNQTSFNKKKPTIKTPKQLSFGDAIDYMEKEQNINLINYMTNDMEFNAHFLTAIRKFLSTNNEENSLKSFDLFKNAISIRDNFSYKQLPEKHKRKFLSRLYELYNKLLQSN